MSTPASPTAPLAPLVPMLRGVLHAGAIPLALAAGIVLVVLAPSGGARVAAGVYALTATGLFLTSALHHRGRFSARTTAALARLDHASIYLLIAGSYTPFALVALRGDLRVAMLVLVWIGALAGAFFRMAWVGAPRALTTGLYLLLGWCAALVIPQFFAGAGVPAMVLVIVGGGLYSIGGLVYGLRRPDPFPRVFGFHEIFHALTLAAFTVQYIAISLVLYGA